jgi:1-acyl-sn-glycerol-3-phosphate acyltransferase
MAVESLEHGRKQVNKYNHAEWETRRRFLRFLLRTLGFTLLAKIDKVEGLENIPKEGPGILMINHIAFIDPIVVLNVMPRNIVPLAKIEVYQYPVINIFPRMWGVIPVKRAGFDRHAVQQVLDVLGAGEIVLVAPEGTRSLNGQLTQGKEGVAYLASRSGAPIIPVAIDGTIGFPALRYTSAWRNPGARVCFGKPFRYHLCLKRANREQLRQMTDEAMYALADLENRRGAYADLSHATQETIEWV